VSLHAPVVSRTFAAARRSTSSCARSPGGGRRSSARPRRSVAVAAGRPLASTAPRTAIPYRRRRSRRASPDPESFVAALFASPRTGVRRPTFVPSPPARCRSRSATSGRSRIRRPRTTPDAGSPPRRIGAA
jgi:hypothetical protein